MTTLPFYKDITMLTNLLIATALLTASSMSQAAPIDIAFGGVLNQGLFSECIGQDPIGCNDWSHVPLADTSFYDGINFAVGDNFSGTMSYDAEGAIYNVFGDTAYYFGWDGLSVTSDFEIGGEQSFLPGFSSLEYASANVTNSERFDVLNVDQLGFTGSWTVLVSLELFDFSGTMLDSYELPSLVGLTNNSWNTFSITFMDNMTDAQYRFSGDLSEFTMASSSIAAPATYAVFGSALLALMAFRRRTSL